MDVNFAPVSVEPSKRQSVFIYIDETPSFLGIPNANLDEALSQSRQFNVGWNIGFQHLAQMSPQLKAGIESNVANKIVFGLNLDEAREMAKYTLEIDKEDFYSLPPFGYISEQKSYQIPTAGLSVRPTHLNQKLEIVARHF